MTTVSTEQFLLQLQASDVQVWLDGERVRVSVPKDVVIPGLREELAARKADIVAFLSSLPRDAVTADEPPLAARADASPAGLNQADSGLVPDDASDPNSASSSARV